MLATKISRLLVFTLAGAPAAFAQPAPGNPTAQQIINALKPGGQIETLPLQSAKPLPASPAPAAPPSSQAVPQKPVAAPAKAAAAPKQTLSVNLNIDFDPASAALKPDSEGALRQLGKALTDPALAAYNFDIIGHTDTVGVPATNLALSKARAKTVMQYLETRYHIDPARLEATGVGESGLLVATPPQTPNRQNRRVQIVNTGTPIKTSPETP